MRKQSVAPGSLLEDLGSLSVFVRVVEQRSLTSAARSLDVTTSSISKRIAKLEERLGVRLLERTTRRVRLTEAGQGFYERCIAILRAVEDAEAAVTSIGGEPRGTLRVSVPVIFGERHLAPLLPSLLERHPHLRLDVSLSDRFVSLVEEGYDVAVRIGKLADSTLKVKTLATIREWVVASPSYLERRGVPRTPADLADHDCIRYSLLPAQREWRFRRGKRVETPPVGGRLMMSHGGAICEAAIAGAGIARLPSFIADEAIASGALRTVLDEWTSEGQVVAVYPAGRQPQPKVQAFVRFLASRLPSRCHADSVRSPRPSGEG